MGDVPPGRYQLSVLPVNTRIPYVRMKPPLEVTVPSGGEAEAVVDLEPAAQVRGRVVNKATGAGIAGITLWMRRLDGQRTGSLDGDVTTDMDGRFSAYVPPGSHGLVLTQRNSTDYLPPQDRELVKPAEVAAGASHTFPDIGLEPSVTVEGVVVDAAGRPAPGVPVWAAHGDPLDVPPVLTDERGRFTIRGLDPNEPTALRSRTPTAVTDGAVPVPAGPHTEPVRLTLAEWAACRFRGVVVDAAGKPVPSAAVGVEWQCHGAGRSSRYGFVSSVETLGTDSEGRFETHALWPGDRYRVNVAADGFGRAESAQVTGTAGQVHDLGRIVMMRTGGAVAGRVVDAEGKPLAGVRVINSGDAPKRLEATTDAAGRFRLIGFFDGPVYLVTRRDGYRLTLRPTRAGESAVTIRMFKPDAPPPLWPAAESAGRYEDALRLLTRETLEKLWRLPRQVTRGHETNVLENMFRFDPATARRWLAEERERGAKATVDLGQRLVRTAEVETAAAVDADDAIAKVEALKPSAAVDVLLKLARRYRQADPAKAARLAEEAVLRARAVDLPDRAWHLADAAELVARLGQTESARKLIAEAARLAESLGSEGMHGYARGRVAAALAAYDVPQAKRLIEPIPEENERERWAGQMAVRAAPHDLAAALDLLRQLRRGVSSAYARAHMLVAVRLAADQPAEAVRQVEAIADDNYQVRYQVAGLAGVAVEVAPRDPALARTLIDRALARLLDHQDALRSWSNSGGASGLAAWVAYQARRAGHPDMDSVIAYVWAMTPVGPDSPAYLNDQVFHVVTALSLTDPAAARALLARAVPGKQPFGPEAAERREALFALALADPGRASEMIDQKIAAAKKSKDGLQGTGLVELVQVLATPPGDERTRLLGRYVTVYYDLDDED